MHSLDVRPACTQPPLPQPLHMQMPGARPAYTQSAASQTHSTYRVGTQPVSQQGNSPLYNRYVGGAGPVALDPHVCHLGQSTYALTGAQHNWPVHWGLPPLGYPWNLEHGSLGSIHAPPLATPAQNFPYTHGGDDKRGQSVAHPVMTDTEICPLHPRVQWCSASHLWCRLLWLLGHQCQVSSTHLLLF